MPHGKLSSAFRAGPLSPAKPLTPLPARVVMIPWVSTLRTRMLDASAMYKLPERSTATPLAARKEALVAGPPSPPKPELSLPATVVIVPVASTLRIRLLDMSAM
jgi:hypothetical protein